ncbi:hypothetical protein AVEN_173849-1 [Araneus ventricosus]|uniref:Uncharacterized protein n=1 Tax=Araneus ventricosus TaxID=182803 RepID=A0A4Y2QBI2_ARAVE|nr:hypothetical protein AVEN_173849-1 [Araneus ventricosus]
MVQITMVCKELLINYRGRISFVKSFRKEPIVKVKNLSNLEQTIRSGGIRKNLKPAIHRSSKLELLEHGKEGTYRQGEKPAKFGANDSKWWNSKELKAFCVVAVR